MKEEAFRHHSVAGKIAENSLRKFAVRYYLHSISWQSREIAMHFLLIYDVVEDYIERRAEFREAHLKLAREAEARGELVLGGALMEPTDRSLLLFQAETEEPVRAFVRADPYVANGIVKSWQIRKWNTVAGTALRR